MGRREIKAGLASVVLVLLAALGVGLWVHGRATSAIAEHLAQGAQLQGRAVRAEIDRFRYLPSVAGEDIRIRELLADPDDADKRLAAKQYLETVANQSGATFLYLMDDSGLTLAASNWRTSEDLTGNRYDFRPYFQQAIALGTGRYYAIGVTTGKPGYFLARRIDLAPGRRGVMVVKIDLQPLEQAWREAGAGIAIADRHGIVFLTSSKGWKYRPTTALADATIAALGLTRTYDGVDLRAGSPIFSSLGPAGGAGESADRFLALDNGDLAIVHRMPEEGWSLFAHASAAPARSEAAAWAAVTALLGLLLAGALIFSMQRRQLIALRLSQHEMLERKVGERTQDLAREVEVRRNAEHALRKAQDGLVHAEKMAALGRMSAAIAHEVSQPLAALETTLASMRVLLDKTGETAIGARLETARSLVRRMQRTVRHLRSFSRRDSAERERVECGASVREALELARPRAEAVGVTPVVEGAGEFWVDGVPVRLEQVFLNLVLNALDAVEGAPGPRVCVSLSREGESVVVAFADNGRGIAREELDRVREPFYTTKRGGEGLGLGLSISMAIVESHGGGIDIDSAAGEGTTVRVRLPALVEVGHA